MSTPSQFRTGLHNVRLQLRSWRSDTQDRFDAFVSHLDMIRARRRFILIVGFHIRARRLCSPFSVVRAFIRPLPEVPPALHRDPPSSAYRTSTRSYGQRRRPASPEQ